MSGVGRRIRPDVIYDNVNVTTEIEDFIETLSFRDNLSGESDSLSLTLSDREGRWNNQWRPKKGSVLKASLLVSTGWDDPKAKSRFLGIFEIDELGISGPPMTSTVRGLSVPESSSLRKSGKSRAWEKSSLRSVAGAIAKANGMTLYFSADENPSYDRFGISDEVVRRCRVVLEGREQEDHHPGRGTLGKGNERHDHLTQG